jgi:hypothetical protein
MKPLTLVAILLIVVVIATFAYDGVNYTTTEQFSGHGPSPVTMEVTRTIPPLPIVGSVALLGITLLLGTSAKRL